MTAVLDLPLIEFPACANAGPPLVDYPGRRLCNCPKLSVPSGLGVSAEFCSKCPPKYRAEPVIPAYATAGPTSIRFVQGNLNVFRDRPCAHEAGIITTCSRYPATDPRSERRHRRHCSHALVTTDGCTREQVGPEWQACDRCPHYETPWPRVFDQRNLAVELPGRRFNASIIRWGDSGYLLAWRNGWRGSEIYLSELGSDFRPNGRHYGPLALRHSEAGYGREDPRLFMHDGALHVAYIGVVGGSRIRHTSQLYARLNADLTVSRVHYPHYEKRNGWEKNWQFFSHDDALYAIYRAAPHQVLRINGDAARLAFETPWQTGWRGGEIRGGAAPVRVGDEYWCFFHDKISKDGRLVYRMGLYTFEARPPFRPLRVIREPLLSADAGSFKVLHDNYCNCVFPGGAVEHGTHWIIAAGVHDRWAELHRLNHVELETRLVSVGHRAAVESGIGGDVMVAALLTSGSDAFNSGGKVRGEPCKVGELTAAELADYIRPFVATVERWGVRGVVLYDELPPSFIAAHPALTFCRVNPAGVHNYERRWFAWRDWLDANTGVARIWFVDINDVYFTAPPFGELDTLPAGHVVAAVESDWTYATKNWYADQLRHLPADYGDFLLRQHGDANPVNCGAWAADGTTATEVCRRACDHIRRLETHAVANHHTTPIVCDMIAFGRVLYGDFADRIHPIRTDGFPLIHDRPLALAALAGGCARAP